MTKPLTYPAEQAIARLKLLVDVIPPLLQEIPEEFYSYKPAFDQWSKKEILGHLIDSATHNHHRFIRSQTDRIPVINFEEERWVYVTRYQEMDTQLLIEFWTVYNRFLADGFARVGQAVLDQKCLMNDHVVSVAFVIANYVSELTMYLKQILGEDHFPAT